MKDYILLIVVFLACSFATAFLMELFYIKQVEVYILVSGMIYTFMITPLIMIGDKYV